MIRTPTTQLPWHAALPFNATDDEIKDRVRRSVTTSKELDDLAPHAASKLLLSRLKEIYEPGSEEVGALRRVMATVQVHAIERYPTSETFFRIASGPRLPFGEAPCHMVTGLAGDGKTELGHALMRLCDTSLKAPHVPSIPPLPVTGVIHLTVGPRTSVADLLSQIAIQLGIDEGITRADSATLARLRLRMYQYGVLLLIVDELQFLTRSSGASTQITNLLATLASLTVPVLYICNYSLGHKLKKRPHEDRVRLLSDPIVLQPGGPDADSTRKILRGYTTVMGTACSIDLAKHAELIHRFTYSNRRTMARLVSGAYKIARDRQAKQGGVVSVDQSDLEAAFRSASFDSDRIDVKHLHEIALGQVVNRSDLTCPVDRPENESITLGSKRAVDAVRAEALMTAALSKAERESLKALTVDDVGSGTVTKRARTAKRAPRSANAMLDALNGIRPR
jgi:hypothetical protein